MLFTFGGDMTRILYKYMDTETKKYFLSLKKEKPKNGWIRLVICSYEMTPEAYIEMCIYFDPLCLN